MTTWQWIVAWMLYLSATSMWSYKASSRVVLRFIEIDWRIFSYLMAWWIGLGCLLTSVLT